MLPRSSCSPAHARATLTALALALVTMLALPRATRAEDDDDGAHRSRAAEAVLALFAAIDARDLDGVMARLADDVVYANTGLPTFRGKASVQAFLAPVFTVLSGVRFEPIDLLAGRGVVMVRRIDTVDVPPLFGLPARHLAIPVMGYFRVDRAGKITLWADYFDTLTWDTGTGLILPRQFPPDLAD